MQQNADDNQRNGIPIRKLQTICRPLPAASWNGYSQRFILRAERCPFKLGNHSGVQTVIHQVAERQNELRGVGHESELDDGKFCKSGILD